MTRSQQTSVSAHTHERFANAPLLSPFCACKYLLIDPAAIEILMIPDDLLTSASVGSA